ncbi:MAG TPA: helix-turn-helix transcriptional regulator [bacterium]|nr:helix-turn-helix transcriptional regulator [bacterium]HQJ66288.1 helix-turn-helix transcriptional regulator [bacterium]
MKIICNLNKVIAKKGLSQRCLATMAHCTQASISGIATGKCLPKRPVAQRISAALGVGFDSLWPNYDSIQMQHRTRITQGLKRYHQKRHERTEKRKEYHAKYDLACVKKERAVQPADPNAVPLAAGAIAGDYRLRPAKASDDQLQDKKWCRTKALALQDYLCQNCAYGVYRELRALLAAENRLFESRVDRGYEVSL